MTDRSSERQCSAVRPAPESGSRYSGSWARLCSVTSRWISSDEFRTAERAPGGESTFFWGLGAHEDGLRLCAMALRSSEEVLDFPSRFVSRLYRSRVVRMVLSRSWLCVSIPSIL